MDITGLLLAGAVSVGSDISYLTIETDLVAEINAVRTDPRGYAEKLENYRGFYVGNKIQRPGEITVLTTEGVAAVDEAIAVLKTQNPLPPLAPNSRLAAMARDHVADTGPLGLVSHEGADGSTFAIRAKRHGILTGAGENISYGSATAQRVTFQLLIDDGVPSRGHRDNILRKEYKTVGAACGAHSRYEHMCVIDFGM